MKYLIHYFGGSMDGYWQLTHFIGVKRVLPVEYASGTRYEHYIFDWFVELNGVTVFGATFEKEVI